jgi:hypothetical protein
LVLNAGRAADLTGEADAASGIDVAVVAAAVVGGAGDGLALALTITSLHGFARGSGVSGVEWNKGCEE